jgi:glycosyltransferase involved in cell wall biosynthesis
MNILLLSQFFESTRGGGEVVFVTLARQLSNRGHKVHVICQRIRGVSHTTVSDGVIANAVGPGLDHTGGLPATFAGNIGYVLQAVRVGLRVIPSSAIDVIHANNYSPILAGLILSRLTNRPLVVTIHDVAAASGLTFWKRWMRQFKKGVLSAFFGYASELMLVRAPIDAIHAVSDTTRRDLLQIGVRTPIHVIPTGLDIKSYQVDEASLSYDDEILFIGRLIFYKHVEVLLNATKLLARSGLHVRLSVIGDGPMRDEWELTAKGLGIEPCVKFFGYVSHQRKVGALKKATCLVLPSVWEGFGLVILEAWALKKPVVALSVPPLLDIVSDGVDGLLVGSLDEKAWASKIRHLLDRKDEAKRMGAHGYRKLIENYVSDTQTPLIEDVYRMLLERHNRCDSTASFETAAVDHFCADRTCDMHLRSCVPSTFVSTKTAGF